MTLKFSVTQFGEPLDKSKYSWDEKTRTFSTKENNLVLDFTNIDGCTFTTGWHCTFKTGSECTFDTSADCTFTTGWHCTFKTGSGCTFKTGSDCTFITGDKCTFITGDKCTFKTGSYCTFNTGSGCTFKTGSECTFTTGWHCTFNTGYKCTFNTGSGCTFKTGSDCTFITGSECTFTTGWHCTFNTGSECTFTTGWHCTFNTGSDCTFNTGYGCTFITGSECTFTTGDKCIAVRRDIFEVIKLPENKTLTLATCDVCGYVMDGYYYKDDKKQYRAIIADNILSKIISKKTIKNLTVYKVINHNEEDESYLVYDGENYSHGKTLKEAKEDLKYKLSNRDTSQYKDCTLDTTVSLKEAIAMYRTITGACERGTKLFVKGLKKVKDKYTIKEVIELTQGQYESQKFEKFFLKEGAKNAHISS